MNNFYSHIRQSGRFFFSILLIAILISSTAYSQGPLQPILDYDKIIICVNNIAARGEITVRGLTAHFPWPILSTISVVDSAGNIIPGLADPLRWLGPEEIAENGEPIKQIWQPVLEYHEEDTLIPPDPNIYNQKPQPLFTEIRRTDPIPTSTMLVMDVSTSMARDIDKAKEGVCLYLDLFRSGLDRGGIVQFASTVLDYQEMTGDVELLKQEACSATLSEGTAIYDGLMKGIELIKTETGRRAIIVYTDGGDNASTTTPQAVIDNARAYNIPIYTIALGANTEDDVLIQIADATSALFFKAATAEEMKIIYGKLSVMMQNYYVMAHASPDPNYNQTWRLVDVTANLSGVSGRAMGRYFVPGPPPQFFTDLSVSLESKTDTTIFVDRDSIHAAKPGEIFDYIIRYKNFGHDRAETVRLRHILPDSVRYISASILPQINTEDSLEWTFPGIMPGVEDSIIVTVQLADTIPLSLAKIFSQAKIYAPDDTSPENNFDSDTTRVLFPASPKKYDLSVSHTTSTDTTIDIAGKTYNAVVQGESYSYRIKIFNKGPVPALNFTLWDVLPDSVTPSEFNKIWTEQKSDTLFWQFPFLEIGDSIIVSFTANVESLLPYLPFPLVNITELIAENDSLTENNIFATTVYGIARQKPSLPLTDLSLALTSTTAKKIIVGSDSMNAVMPGETFQYQINIANLGMNPADTVKIVHVLPDSVGFINSSPIPQGISGNSLTWEFLNWQPSEIKTILVNVQLAESIPPDLNIIISEANLFSRSDSTEANNSDADTIKVIFEEPPPLENYDLSIKQFVSRDTTIMVGDESFPAVWAGNSYKYTLKITNFGPEVATDFEVWDVFPDSASLSNFDVPVSRQTPDTLFWRFNSLAAGDSLKINFDALSAKSLPFYPFPLLNETGIIATNDTTAQNNQDTTIVYVIKKSPTSSFATDLALNMVSITDSTIIINEETSNVVFPGENYHYSISIDNKGLYQADSVRLVHTLPDLVSFISATVTPKSLSNDSLIWEFDFIEPLKKAEILIFVKLSDQAPRSLIQLFSRAEIVAKNDSTSDNNIAEDIVLVRFQETPPTKRNFNLAVQQDVIPDTTIIIAGESKAAVFRGATYSYKIKVENFGPVAARDFSIWDLPPDLVSIVGQSTAPTRLNNDTLFWQIDALDVGESLTIDLDAKVADTLPFTPFPLLNRVGLIAEQDTMPDDNFSDSLAYAIARSDDPHSMNADIAVSQLPETDSTSVSDNVTRYYVKAGEKYSYQLTIFNASQVPAEDVIVTDFISDSVTTSDYQPAPNIIAGDSIQWRLGYLLPQATAVLQFNATVRSIMPVGKNILTNHVTAVSSNEDPARLANNASSQDVINLVKPAGGWQPFIDAKPSKVKVGSNIKVLVQVTVPVDSWDLWIYLADGTIERDYGDRFIAATDLVPNQWIEIDPQYAATRMYSSEDNEPLIFELQVVDVFGESKTARATVEIESDDDFIVRRNVFIPDQEREFPIHFKISSDCMVRIDIYDITGTKIFRIFESHKTAGKYDISWDGSTENGQKIGSGFYILTIHSGEYSAWKKLIIVR
jgi:uncharacterized repeat protein (TIGR01451 family)